MGAYCVPEDRLMQVDASDPTTWKLYAEQDLCVAGCQSAVITFPLQLRLAPQVAACVEVWDVGSHHATTASCTTSLVGTAVNKVLLTVMNASKLPYLIHAGDPLGRVRFNAKVAAPPKTCTGSTRIPLEALPAGFPRTWSDDPCYRIQLAEGVFYLQVTNQSMEPRAASDRGGVRIGMDPGMVNLIDPRLCRRWQLAKQTSAMLTTQVKRAMFVPHNMHRHYHMHVECDHFQVTLVGPEPCVYSGQSLLEVMLTNPDEVDHSFTLLQPCLQIVVKECAA
jgi:hypothetical protein